MTGMTTTQFLAYLRGLDIELWVQDGRLHYDAPPGALTPDLRDQLVVERD